MTGKLGHDLLYKGGKRGEEKGEKKRGEDEQLHFYSCLQHTEGEVI